MFVYSQLIIKATRKDNNSISAYINFISKHEYDSVTNDEGALIERFLVNDDFADISIEDYENYFHDEYKLICHSAWSAINEEEYNRLRNKAAREY